VQFADPHGPVSLEAPPLRLLPWDTPANPAPGPRRPVPEVSARMAAPAASGRAAGHRWWCDCRGTTPDRYGAGSPPQTGRPGMATKVAVALEDDLDGSQSVRRRRKMHRRPVRPGEQHRADPRRRHSQGQERSTGALASRLAWRHGCTEMPAHRPSPGKGEPVMLQINVRPVRAGLGT
jgi:hypothetical protein